MLPVCLFSNTASQMTSKCGKNKKVAHGAISECVTDVFTTFWCHLWSITEQTHGNMEFYLFYIIKKQTTTLDTRHLNLSTYKLESSGLPTLVNTWKAIWHNLLSIQNEAISLVAMSSNELRLVQENHATVKLDANKASHGMKTYSERELNCEIYKSWRKRLKSQVRAALWAENLQHCGSSKTC